jgi:hypothetical protein
MALGIAPSGPVVAAGAGRGVPPPAGPNRDARMAAPQPITIDKGKVPRHRTYFPDTLQRGNLWNRRRAQ